MWSTVATVCERPAYSVHVVSHRFPALPPENVGRTAPRLVRIGRSAHHPRPLGADCWPGPSSRPLRHSSNGRRTRSLSGGRYRRLVRNATGFPSLPETGSTQEDERGRRTCLLYTSDAADDLTRVDLGGRR